LKKTLLEEQNITIEIVDFEFLVSNQLVENPFLYDTLPQLATIEPLSEKSSLITFLETLDLKRLSISLYSLSDSLSVKLKRTENLNKRQIQVEYELKAKVDT